MLVSAEGTWMLEDSAEFRAALGDPKPDYDGAAFAVKNLGFLKFQILDNSIIEIDLHPHNVEIPALLAVQQQLLKSQIKLFRLKYFDLSWKSEIICSAELAVARLSELCAPRFALSDADRFLVEPQDYLRLYESEQGPLQLMAQKWRMSFGHFDPSVIAFAIKKDLLSRLIMVGVKRRGPNPYSALLGMVTTIGSMTTTICMQSAEKCKTNRIKTMGNGYRNSTRASRAPASLVTIM